MSIQVKLKDIIEEMEVQFEESRSLLNIKTGEIVIVLFFTNAPISSTKRLHSEVMYLLTKLILFLFLGPFGY
jgi:hypothetical protein